MSCGNIESMIYIYGLSEPDDEFNIRYIGKTNNLSKRYYKHMTELNGNNHKINWIKKLIKTNKKPKLIVIEECNINNWADEEKYWIKYYKDWGYDLTNETNGGDSPVFSPEALKRMSESHKGKVLPKEQRKKMSLSSLGNTNCLGNHLSEEHRKNIGRSNKGKNLGRIHSEDWKRKTSEAGKGRVPWNKGKPFPHPGNRVGIPQSAQFKLNQSNRMKEVWKKRKLLRVS